MTQFVEQLQDIVREATAVRVMGACSKAARPEADGIALLDMRAHSGVIDYQPGEFIIQARAGTPVRDVAGLLASYGQYLPFDPMRVEAGATLGGTVAANASGPERFRYGGVRDFIIGCHFVDGTGELLSGGGKVVKNAAGFDYPKLFVGSFGSLGILLDVCFKVFPRPEVYNTLLQAHDSITAAADAMLKLAGAPLDIHALELASTAKGFQLEVRVGGLQGGIRARMDRVRAIAGGGDIVEGAAESEHWQRVRELTWLGKDECAIKLPITPRQMAGLDRHFRAGQARRYGAGGNAAWVSLPRQAHDQMHALCKTEGVVGMAFCTGAAENARGARFGEWPANPFAERVRRVLDPHRKFATASPL